MNRLQKSCLAIAICVVIGSTPAHAVGDCSDYTDLTGLELPITVNGTTTGATADYGPFTEQPSCWHGVWDASCAYGGDVTYKWTAPDDGRFTFTLFGSSSNADLQIYQFTCPAEPIYPDDFICGSHRSWMNTATVREVELAAGQEVLIVVDGWLVWSGDFTLRIYDTTTNSGTVAMGMDLFQFAGFTGASAWGGAGRWGDELGLANAADSIPVHDDHLFSMGGTSRAVTAMAVMQLWEDGLFGLDDDVGLYLPFSVRNPHHPDTPITFRMLLSHTSSISDHGALVALRSEGEDSPVSICDLAEGWLAPGGVYYGPSSYFDFEPGTDSYDSNVGVTLLACLVEHINPDGLSFEDYCRANIFEPLGMRSSSFLLSNVDPADLVTRHFRDGEEFGSLPVTTGPWYPAEFLWSNGREMSRLLLAYASGGEYYGERVLDQPTIELMCTVNDPEVSSTMGLIWRYRESPGVWALNTAPYNDFLLSDYAGVAIDPVLGRYVVGVTNTTGGIAVEGYNEIWTILADLLRRGEEDAATGTAAPDASPAFPVLVQLEPCYPNPFNPQTSIRFEMPISSHVCLTIHDLRGQLVSTLLNAPMAAGSHAVKWSGRYDDGREAPSGVYFSRLEAGEHVTHGKMALIR